MDIKETIGSNIRKHRKELGIGQEKLANMAGIHRTHMSLIERGQANITIEVLERIAKQLGVKPRELI